MTRALFVFLITTQILVGGLDCLAQISGSSPKNAQKYELKLVTIFEGTGHEFIFVIGEAGFRSVASLKKFLVGLPGGSELTWAPGCARIGGEPLLSSEADMGDFQEFLRQHDIKFVLVPSG